MGVAGPVRENDSECVSLGVQRAQAVAVAVVAVVPLALSLEGWQRTVAVAVAEQGEELGRARVVQVAGATRQRLLSCCLTLMRRSRL